MTRSIAFIGATAGGELPVRVMVRGAFMGSRAFSTWREALDWCDREQVHVANREPAEQMAAHEFGKAVRP